MQETSEMWVQSLDQEDPLEEGMATHSSILAWRIPWTEPGRLQFIELQRVRHKWNHLGHSTHRLGGGGAIRDSRLTGSLADSKTLLFHSVPTEQNIEEDIYPYYSWQICKVCYKKDILCFQRPLLKSCKISPQKVADQSLTWHTGLI